MAMPCPAPERPPQAPHGPADRWDSPPHPPAHRAPWCFIICLCIGPPRRGLPKAGTWLCLGTMITSVPGSSLAECGLSGMWAVCFCTFLCKMGRWYCLRGCGAYIRSPTGAAGSMSSHAMSVRAPPVPPSQKPLCIS